jgi:hypothetical protein
MLPPEELNGRESFGRRARQPVTPGIGPVGVLARRPHRDDALQTELHGLSIAGP